MAASLVLLVDDESKILSSLTRELLEMDVCEVQTARSGAEGLEFLRKTDKVSVIVSDYHMPGMDGISFLCEAQKICPDTTRIMLTGAAGLEMAIRAVNLGQIFRFLLKPCPAEILIPAVKSGIRQNQLITSERELLQKTLNGSIKIMVDMLSALNPESFAQANRLRVLASSLAFELKMENLWEVELAALLCRIGSVTVPPEVLTKWMRGYPLTDAENSMVLAIPRIGERLVQNIPRLENVSRSIGCQMHSYQKLGKIPGSLVGEHIPIIGRILKLVVDYDRFLETNQNVKAVQEQMLKQPDEYDPDLLTIFCIKVLGIHEFSKKKSVEILPHERKVNIEDVQLGMILVRDVVDRRGRLVVSKGTVITEILKSRLVNFFWTQAIVEPVVVGEEKFL